MTCFTMNTRTHTHTHVDIFWAFGFVTVHEADDELASDGDGVAVLLDVALHHQTLVVGSNGVGSTLENQEILPGNVPSPFGCYGSHCGHNKRDIATMITS